MVAGAIAVTLATAGASAAPPVRMAKAKRPPAVVFGGFTPQRWPVVVEVSRDRRKVVRASIGLDLPCANGNVRADSDSYAGVPLSKKGAFKASFTGDRADYPDGSFDVLEGSVRGKANAARTRMSGTWHLQVTEHDASTAVVTTCDSGIVKWKAKQ